MVSVQKASRVNGLLQLDLSSNSSSVSINQTIPKQTLILERVRVEMTSSAASLATGRVYIDLPWVSPSAIINTAPHSRVMVLLDNNNVSLRDPKIALDLKENIQPTFDVRVFDVTGALVSNLVNVQMVFSYDYGFHT